MTAATATMRRTMGDWWNVVAFGLIGAAVAIYLCIVGIVPTFHRQQLIFGLVTIGQTFILLAMLATGYIAARKMDAGRIRPVGAGTLAGAIVGVGLALLVIIGPAINLRSIFLRAGPELYNVVTLGNFAEGPVAALVPLVGGILLGAGAGVVTLLPRAVQQAIGLAIVTLIVLGVLSGFVRNPLLASPVAELQSLGRLLFASQGVQVQGAVVTLSSTLGLGLGGWLGDRFGGRRGSMAGGLIGGLLLSLLGGWFFGVPGAAIGGALGMVAGALTGAYVERWLGRVEAGARYAALPETQRRLTLAPLFVGVLLLVLALPYAAGSVYAATVVLVALYMLMGFGLNITLGLAGLLDLGFVAFFAVGAYTVGLLTSLGQFGLVDLPSVSLPMPAVLAILGMIVAVVLARTLTRLKPRATLALTVAVGVLGFAVFALIIPATGSILLGPFWWAIPFAVLVAFLFGAFLGLPVLGIRGDYLAIATLGFGEIIAILARSNLLIPLIGGPQGVTLIPKPFIVDPVHPLAGPTQIYYLALVFAALVAFVAYRLRDSRLGRAWLAIREDEDVAEALGINLVQTKLLAYSLGAAFAGLGGALWAANFGAVFPSDINLFVSINAAAIIIVGGMGSIPGVVLGALFLIGVPELLRDVGGTEYRFLFYGVALIMMMRFRPEGIFPSRVIRRELHVEEENIEEPDATVGESVGAPEGAQYPPEDQLTSEEPPTGAEYPAPGRANPPKEGE